MVRKPGTLRKIGKAVVCAVVGVPVRSEAYYAWRYGQHPNVTYYVHPLLLSDRNDTPLAGFAVLRPNVRFGWQEVVLCDMVLGEPSYSLGQKLMRSLVQNLLADYVIAHFAPGTVEYDSIHRSRFLRPAIKVCSLRYARWMKDLPRYAAQAPGTYV